MDDCIINPLTGRAVKKDSPAGRRALKYNSKNNLEPSNDCVINPLTGRAVKKDGALGRKILKGLITAPAPKPAPKPYTMYKKPIGPVKPPPKPYTMYKKPIGPVKLAKKEDTNKEDTNRLHNLPKDLQEKIMGMANDKWTPSRFKMSDGALWTLLLGYELAVNQKIFHNGWEPEVYIPNWKDNYVINFMKEYLPDEYAKITYKSQKVINDSDFIWNGARLYIKWIYQKNASPKLAERMERRRIQGHEKSLNGIKNHFGRLNPWNNKSSYRQFITSENNRFNGWYDKSVRKGVVRKYLREDPVQIIGIKLTDKEGNFKDNVVLMFDVFRMDDGRRGGKVRYDAVKYFTNNFGEGGPIYYTDNFEYNLYKKST